MTNRPLHPRHGTHRPTQGTPDRRPGSVRRTSTVDMLRPDGLSGSVVVDARSRDLRAGEDMGESTRISAEIDYLGGWTLRRITADPPDDRLESLLGESVAGGFRRRVQAALPEHYADATRLHLLLDDFPVATLVSGVALHAGGFAMGSVEGMAFQADLCSGWRSGGTIMVGIERDRAIPVVTGPEAPELNAPSPTAPARGASAMAVENDAEGEPGTAGAWHERSPLPPHSVRRARRLDVWEDGGLLAVDSLYRDSHVDADGRETVIHEWALHGRVDPADYRIVEMAATARVLPWVECPSAGASADRLAGLSVRELRPTVRREFRGISTCTHLNDQMRQLADVPALVGFSAVR